jgi:NADH-quinone oxidoreductase subunit N
MTEMLMIEDLYAVMPELILALGALVALLGAAYIKAINVRGVAYFASFIAFAAMISAATSTGQNVSAFFDTFVIDPFATNLKIAICASVAAVLLLMAGISKLADQKSELFVENPVLMLLSAVGMCLMVSSKSLLVLYMSLELMSLPLYILTSCNRTNSDSQEAGLKYFILGALASCIYLFGTSIVYGFSGSVDFTSISNYYASTVIGDDGAYNDIPIGFLVGIILILTSFCFKLSAAPFHMWTPDVYQGSPTITTALLAAAPKIAALGALLRLLYGPFFVLIDQLQQIIVFVAVMSMFVGNLGAIMQRDFKRLIAYSTIGHIGFILMGVSSGEIVGIQHTIFYALIYITMTIPLFALLLMLKKDGQYKTDIAQLAGLAKSSPILAAAIAVLMFSMAGIPPFAGFFAKFYILYSIILEEMYMFAIVGIIVTVIGSYYYLKVIKVMYFDQSHMSNDNDAHIALKILATLGIAINLGYVLFPEPIMQFAKEAAENLLYW